MHVRYSTIIYIYIYIYIYEYKYIHIYIYIYNIAERMWWNKGVSHLKGLASFTLSWILAAARTATTTSGSPSHRCACMYTGVHVCIQVCMYVYRCACMYTGVHVCIYVCIIRLRMHHKMSTCCMYWQNFTQTLCLTWACLLWLFCVCILRTCEFGAYALVSFTVARVYAEVLIYLRVCVGSSYATRINTQHNQYDTCPWHVSLTPNTISMIHFFDLFL